MKEIKLWKIAVDEQGKPVVQQLENVNQTETENHLEDILVRSPELLLKDLKLVGRQTETPGGPLDLLGIDGDGSLVVFELKRGTLNREAIAQIIDYASYLTELSPDELSKHISERSGKLGIEKITDFSAWYQEQFPRDIPISQKIRMVLVGLGVDARTLRMASFLAKSDIDISLITFYGFEKDGNIFLARHLEVESKPPFATTRTKMNNLEKLQMRVKDLHVGDYFYEMSAFFRNQLAAYEYPNPGGYSYSLSDISESGSPTYRVYIALYLSDPHPGRVEIAIYPRAIEVSLDAFNSIKDMFGEKIKYMSDGGAKIWIKSLHEWQNMQSYFEQLCPAILEGWKKKREREVVEEFQEALQESSEKEKSGEVPDN